MSPAAEAVPRFRLVFLARLQYGCSHSLKSPALASPSPQYAWTCSARRSWSGIGRRRAFSAVGAPAAASVEEVAVACRSNGEITLNIFRPVADEAPASPVILYLPTAPRGDYEYGAFDDEIITALLAASNSTIVRVNYRLGDGVQYPTPVHDVLAGYDYVKERFAQESRTTRSGRLKKSHLRMGVCGQFVGGSLAAMLGLTESRLGEDRIAATALNCATVDWVFPETLKDVHQPAAIAAAADGEDQIVEKVARRRRRKAVQLPSWEAFSDADGLTTAKLEAARHAFFKKPADYFDPFATPMHFLRSAGARVPQEQSVDPDEISLLASTTPKPRKTHRNFPPSNSSLILPHMRVSVGAANPLLDQTEEFVKLLRRSVVRSVQSRASTQALLDRFDEEVPATDTERLAAAVAAAEEKVEYHVGSGTGLWGTAKSEEWLDEVWDVGRWFRKILG